MSSPKYVEQWLESLVLHEYWENFINSGFNTLEKCSTLTDEQLQSIGISRPGHRSRILNHRSKAGDLHRDLIRCGVIGQPSTSGETAPLSDRPTVFSGDLMIGDDDDNQEIYDTPPPRKAVPKLPIIDSERHGMEYTNVAEMDNIPPPVLPPKKKTGSDDMDSKFGIFPAKNLPPSSPVLAPANSPMDPEKNKTRVLVPQVSQENKTVTPVPRVIIDNKTPVPVPRKSVDSKSLAGTQKPKPLPRFSKSSTSTGMKPENEFLFIDGATSTDSQSDVPEMASTPNSTFSAIGSVAVSPKTSSDNDIKPYSPSLTANILSLFDNPTNNIQVTNTNVNMINAGLSAKVGHTDASAPSTQLVNSSYINVKIGPSGEVALKDEEADFFGRSVDPSFDARRMETSTRLHHLPGSSYVNVKVGLSGEVALRDGEALVGQNCELVYETVDESGGKGNASNQLSDNFFFGAFTGDVMGQGGQPSKEELDNAANDLKETYVFPEPDYDTAVSVMTGAATESAWVADFDILNNTANSNESNRFSTFNDSFCLPPPTFDPPPPPQVVYDVVAPVLPQREAPPPPLPLRKLSTKYSNNTSAAESHSANVSRASFGVMSPTAVEFSEALNAHFLPVSPSEWIKTGANEWASNLEYEDQKGFNEDDYLEPDRSDTLKAKMPVQFDNVIEHGARNPDRTKPGTGMALKYFSLFQTIYLLICR